MNRAKSSVFVGNNTIYGVEEEICRVLNFQQADDNIMYLGLPNILGRKKTMILGNLKDRLQGCIQE